MPISYPEVSARDRRGLPSLKNRTALIINQLMLFFVYGSRYGVPVPVTVLWYRIKSATGMRIPFLKLASEQNRSSTRHGKAQIVLAGLVSDRRPTHLSPAERSFRQAFAKPSPIHDISWQNASFPSIFSPHLQCCSRGQKLSQHPTPSHMFIHGLVCATGLLPGARP